MYPPYPRSEDNHGRTSVKVSRYDVFGYQKELMSLAKAGGDAGTHTLTRGTPNGTELVWTTY